MDRASDYLEKAMAYFSDNFDVSFKIIIYDTYLDLNSENGDKLFNDILLLLKKHVVITEHQQYLPICMDKLHKHLLTNKDWDNLENIVYALVDYCDQEGENRPLDELMVIAFSIIIDLGKNGRSVLREKSR